MTEPVVRYLEVPADAVDTSLAAYGEYALTVAMITLRPRCPRPSIRWMIAGALDHDEWPWAVHEHGRHVNGAVYVADPDVIWIRADQALASLPESIGHELEHVDQLHIHGPMPEYATPAVEAAAQTAGRMVAAAILKGD